MMPKDQKIADHLINHESSIMTSDTNKELKKRIAHYELSAYFFGDPGGIRTPDPRLRRNDIKTLCSIISIYCIKSLYKHCILYKFSFIFSLSTLYYK